MRAAAQEGPDWICSVAQEEGRRRLIGPTHRGVVEARYVAPTGAPRGKGSNCQIFGAKYQKRGQVLSLKECD